MPLYPVGSNTGLGRHTQAIVGCAKVGAIFGVFLGAVLMHAFGRRQAIEWTGLFFILGPSIMTVARACPRPPPYRKEQDRLFKCCLQGWAGPLQSRTSLPDGVCVWVRGWVQRCRG
jgi:hypothetical protein